MEMTAESDSYSQLGVASTLVKRIQVFILLLPGTYRKQNDDGDIFESLVEISPTLNQFQSHHSCNTFIRALPRSKFKENSGRNIIGQAVCTRSELTEQDNIE